MKVLNSIILSLTFTFTIFNATSLNAHPGNDSLSQNVYFAESDPTGRLVTAWLDAHTKSLNVAIDQKKPTVISLTDQNCHSFQIKFTPNGDIIAVWFGKMSDSDYYSLHGATLPYEGKWTKAKLIPNSDELIIAKTYRLVVNGPNEVNVFWETVNFYPSPSNPEQLTYNRELRRSSGSLKSWGIPKTIALLEEGR